MSFGGASGSTKGTEASGKKGGTTSKFRKERLDISDEAVDKIIADVLGGVGGLAEIFQGEQTAGIFDSSVTAQAAGDLTSKLAGEIAKLRAVKITEEEGEFDEFFDTRERETEFKLSFEPKL